MAPVKRKIWHWIALISGGICTLLCLIIHVLTIVIAYQYSGIFLAVISSIMPVLSEIYWAFKLWKITGIFLNDYTLILIAIVISGFIGTYGIQKAEAI